MKYHTQLSYLHILTEWYYATSLETRVPQQLILLQGLRPRWFISTAVHMTSSLFKGTMPFGLSKLPSPCYKLNCR